MIVIIIVIVVAIIIIIIIVFIIIIIIIIIKETDMNIEMCRDKYIDTQTDIEIGILT